MAATLSQLRERIKARADMVGSDFRSDAEILPVINASYARLYRKIIGVYEDYFSSTTTIALISGTDTYSLSAVSPKVRKIRGVDFLHSGGCTYRYCLRGSNLVFAPLPNVTNNVKVYYVPELTKLVDDGDSIQEEIKEGWEEFIVLDAAITLLRDQESDTREMAAERDDILKDIASDASVRDADAPAVMVRSRRPDVDCDEECW